MNGEVEWEADERPEPRSLGLLPSGPDPVGEWLVHRHPPAPISTQPRQNASGRRPRSTRAIDGGFPVPGAARSGRAGPPEKRRQGDEGLAALLEHVGKEIEAVR